jgi:hypothetical protein
MGYTGEQKREYQRKWLAARRADFFKDKVCVVCGSSEKLELDHIDKSTKITHRIWSWSTARREEELTKCQVLCEEHHLQKTVEENTYAAPHGTWQRYHSKKHSCRCQACKDAAAEYKRKQRERARR